MHRPPEMSALQAGYLNCPCCGQLHQLVTGAKVRCRRCHSVLHPRTPQGLSKAWLFSLLALVCLVPAHLLPIMTVIFMGSGEPDTIMSGVITLIQFEMYPIALVVFIASVAIPFLKLFALWGLLLSVHRRSPPDAQQRTHLYRFVEVIGKWSMIDVFVIALLMALVDLGSIATIEAGPGATAFCLAVALTMLAAQSFDPRLIWDFRKRAE